MKSPSLEFLRSALDQQYGEEDIAAVLDWLEKRNNAVNVKITRARFDNLKHWHFDDKSSNLRHISGGFFSIDGVRVQTNWGAISEWEQPIINQPEIGFLGIIVKEIKGVWHFLMQAKIEPGNVNNVQLSPTLQATKSNYTMVHKGQQPRYLEYFLDDRKTVLLDQLQSEQGARFLRKRNRNIIVLVQDNIPPHEDFIWLTLSQIIRLMRFNNVVNMDTRTVISGIPFGDYHASIVDFYSGIGNRNKDAIGTRFLRSCLSSENSLRSFDEILSWMTGLKSFYDLKVEKIPLREVSGWEVREDEIARRDGKYFRIIPVEVEIENREVRVWNQPLVEPSQEGVCGFIVKDINGILHFLVQAKLECGNHDIIEMAPTIQCLTGNYRESGSDKPLFVDFFLDAEKENFILDTLQSEEGGRFYREQNRNMILEAGEEFPVEVPGNYCWMTLNQLKTFLKFNNFLNIQARSLIAAINFS
jgi:oxidase EvaA